MTISKEQFYQDLDTLHDDINNFLDPFIHEDTVVKLGGEDTDSLRRMVKKIKADQNNLIDQGLATIGLEVGKAAASADKAASSANEIKNLSADAVSLDSGLPATASYSPSTGVMLFGIPRGKAPAIDVIDCGGPDERWVAVVDGGLEA